MNYRCVLAMLALLLLPGCFFSRSKLEQPLDPANLQTLVVGMSDQADVQRALGSPTDIIFNNKNHDPLRVFAYEYVYRVQKTTGFTIIILTFIEADAKRDRVMVFFDENGKVSSIASSFDAEEASYGLPFGD